MYVSGLPQQACRTVPGAIAIEAGMTVHDVHEYLSYREWGIALDMLAELGGPPSFVSQSATSL